MSTRRIDIISAVALWVALAAPPAAPAAPAGLDVSEDKLLAVLGSDAPLHDKARACQQLALVGTAKAVPTLAGLLGDERLGDYARFALEPIADASVDEALREALGKCTGRLRAGVVTSIGVRRDAGAVDALAKLVGDREAAVAPVALAALGRIATDEAIEAVRKVLTAGPAALKAPAADACLAAAERLRAGGKSDAAGSLYDTVRQADLPGYLRAAAVRGAILARGSAGLGALVEALRSTDREVLRAAMGAARELPGPAVSQKLAAELARATPAVQVLLIDVLARRGDGGARKAIVALAGSDARAVRVAAVTALGAVGDAASAGVLVRALGSAGAESAAASRSLRTLGGDGVDEAILAGMKTAKGPVRVELIDVLAARQVASAVPALLADAGADDEPAARAALKALATLAEPKDAPALVSVLTAARSDRVRSQAENTVVAVTAKIADATKRPGPVLAAWAAGPKPAVRCSLLRVLGRIGGEKAFEIVTGAASDKDATIRDAGIRALAAWGDGRAEAALLKLVKTADSETHRVLALRGYVRLLGLSADRRGAETAAKYAEVLAITRRGDSKKLVLAGLASVGHADALALAMKHVGAPAVGAEAASAAVRIAGAILGTDRDATRSAMEKLLAGSKAPAIVAEAKRILAAIDKFADSLTAWRVAGPYQKKGATYRELFDVAFEPEARGAKSVAFRPLPAGTDPKRPGILDLLKAIGGEQRAAYVLTWVHSDKPLEARLELGSDDGVKAWLNGKLVHGKNMARAAEAYTDRADVTLRAGWNALLLKITQNNSRWEFCARLCGRDGKRLGGLRIDPAHEGDWMSPGK